MNQKIQTICIIGLGYVGLPLAVKFSEHFNVIGFDVSEKRVEELKQGKDLSKEVEDEDLKKAKIFFTSNPSEIKQADFVIDNNGSVSRTQKQVKEVFRKINE